MDIEGYELDALPEWVESGVLEKVFLFAFLSSLFPVGVLEKVFFCFLPHCF